MAGGRLRRRLRRLRLVPLPASRRGHRGGHGAAAGQPCLRRQGQPHRRLQRQRRTPRSRQPRQHLAVHAPGHHRRRGSPLLQRGLVGPPPPDQGGLGQPPPHQHQRRVDHHRAARQDQLLQQPRAVHRLQDQGDRARQRARRQLHQEPDPRDVPQPRALREPRDRRRDRRRAVLLQAGQGPRPRRVVDARRAAAVADDPEPRARQRRQPARQGPPARGAGGDGHQRRHHPAAGGRCARREAHLPRLVRERARTPIPDVKDYVTSWLQSNYGNNYINPGGWDIFTTIDPTKQVAADQDAARRHPQDPQHPQRQGRRPGQHRSQDREGARPGRRLGQQRPGDRPAQHGDPAAQPRFDDQAVHVHRGDRLAPVHDDDADPRRAGAPLAGPGRSRSTRRSTTTGAGTAPAW